MNETARRFLIVNADDFGLGAGINRGVIHAHEHGVVTSASLMVRWPAATEAAALAKTHPRLSVGLHVEIAEWFFRDGEWEKNYEVVPAGDAEAVAAEVQRQLAHFRALTGSNPTHLDSHQHLHRDEPLRSILGALARELRVPLRDFTPGIQYCGDFYGQSNKGVACHELLEVAAFAALIGRLRNGITELGCHPGLIGDFESVYREEREIEVRTLCDERLRPLLAAGGVELRSFHDPASAGTEW